MPTYEYRCTDCGRSFEQYQSFADDPITVCPLPLEDEALNGTVSARTVSASGGPASTASARRGSACGGAVRKVFSNVGISFKGSGFYRNDSRAAQSSEAKKPSADSSSDKPEDASPSSASSSSSPDKSGSASKPESSPDSAPSKSKTSSAVGAASASG